MTDGVNIKNGTEHKITFPEITIKGVSVNVSIDNKPYGALIEYFEKGVSRGMTMKNLGVNFDYQHLIYEYWSFILDEDGDVVNHDYHNYQYPNYSGWDEFYFYQPQSELGVVSSKFGINAMMYDKFGVRCFADNGEFYQPITFDSVTVHETATYNPHYSLEYIEDNGGATSGLENVDDFTNADGQITINVVDGEGPYTYSVFDGNDFVVNSDNVFDSLIGNIYLIKVEGKNAAGTSGLVVEQVEEVVVLKPIMFGIGEDVDADEPDNCSIYVQSVINNYGLTEYKLNDGEWTVDSHFSGVSRGEHTVQVRDANGTIASKQVFL